jgi:hypothetical protein
MSALTATTSRNGHAPPIRSARPCRVGVYARVSTADQIPENQLAVLRAFADARGWTATEYVDHGISGARTSRPALDALLAAARARRLDVVLATKLDRLARSTRHLVDLAAELEALGVDLVVTDQAIDTTTPAGRLLFHVLAAIAEFERGLIRERVVAGIRRARAGPACRPAGEVSGGLNDRPGPPRRRDVAPWCRPATWRPPERGAAGPGTRTGSWLG